MQAEERHTTKVASFTGFKLRAPDAGQQSEKPERGHAEQYQEQYDTCVARLVAMKA